MPRKRTFKHNSKMEQAELQTNKKDSPKRKKESPFAESHACDQNRNCSTSGELPVNFDIENIEIDGKYVDIFRLVTSNYIIVKTILQYLDWRQIRTSSLVCKLWNEVANNIYKSNLSPQHFCSANRFRVQNGPYEIDREPKALPMLILVFLGKIARKVEGSRKYLSYSNPEMGIPHDKKYRMLDSFSTTLAGYSSTITGVFCDEVIHPEFVPCSGIRYNSLLGAGGVYIPRIHGVKVHNFYQQSDKGSPANGDVTKEKILTLIKTEYIKCLLIFTSSDVYNAAIKDIVNVVKLGQGAERPFAVGGCVVEYTQFYNPINQHLADEFLSFTVITVERATPENPIHFEAFSKVTAVTRDSEEKITANIVQMSELIPRREHSVAIKLSCIGRTDTHISEQAAFDKYFPNTKTVGCFGLGEIGLDCLPCQSTPKEATKSVGSSDPVEKSRSRKQRSDKLIHYYSSVMVMLSWGNLK